MHFHRFAKPIYQESIIGCIVHEKINAETFQTKASSSEYITMQPLVAKKAHRA